MSRVFPKGCRSQAQSGSVGVANIWHTGILGILAPTEQCKGGREMIYVPQNNNEWEESEREADEDIKMGRVKSFNSVEELIDELNSEDGEVENEENKS